MVLKECLACQVCLEFPECQGRKDHRERKEKREKLVIRDRQERWEGKGSRGKFPEARETKDHPEYEDHKVPLGRKDLKGTRDNMELRD